MNEIDTLERAKNKNIKTRKLKDFLLGGNSSLFAFICLGMLIWIISYVFINGSSLLNWDYITGDYSKTVYTLKSPEGFTLDKNITYDDIDTNNEYTSKVWGVSFKYYQVNSSTTEVHIDKMSSNSPFYNLVDSSTNKVKDSLKDNSNVTYITLLDESGNYVDAYASQGITSFVSDLDKGVYIVDSSFISTGGGIRGSLLNTLALIGLSLLISLPIGIGGAIYLGVYAKDNRLTRILRSLIDMTSGIPSIILGLAGALIFIPFSNAILSSKGGNLLSGALTMTMILLPTIVKTVEESIRIIPNSLIQGSLSLGASKTQTVFKVIIPNALSGILTSTLLSIGRIIGESAALVFALGTTISESVSLSASSATLAVHIWVILGGDNPSYDSACAISIIIIIIVLILSVLVKLISYRLNRFKEVR